MNFFNRKLKNDSNPIKIMDKDRKNFSVNSNLTTDKIGKETSNTKKDISSSSGSQLNNVPINQKIAIIEQEKNMLKLTLDHIIIENKELKQKLEDMEQTVIHNKTQLKDYVENIANKDSLFAKLNNTIEILQKRLNNYENTKKITKFSYKKEVSFSILSIFQSSKPMNISILSNQNEKNQNSNYNDLSSKLQSNILLQTNSILNNSFLNNSHNNSNYLSNINNSVNYNNQNTFSTNNNVDNFLTKVYKINNCSKLDDLDCQNQEMNVKELNKSSIKETQSTNKILDKSTKVTNDSNFNFVKFNNIDENIRNNLKKYAYHKSKYLSSDFNNFNKFNQSNVKPTNINISNDLSNISNMSIGKNNNLITNPKEQPTKLITSLKKTNIQIIKQSILDKRKKLKEENEFKFNINKTQIENDSIIENKNHNQHQTDTNVKVKSSNNDKINLNNINVNFNVNSCLNTSLNHSMNHNLKLEEISSINAKQNMILDEIKQIKNDLNFIMECSKVSKSKIEKKIKSSSADLNENISNTENKMKNFSVSYMNLSKKYGSKKLKKFQQFLSSYNSENNVLLLVDNLNNIWEITKRNDITLKDIKFGKEIHSLLMSNSNQINTYNKNNPINFSSYSQYNSMNVSRNNSRNFNTSFNNSLNDNSRMNESWLRL